uniref:HTH myb-type domain-containing protein n=1 Tax=Peronospora matthiolae TaxID=2874970 RepID=A0AAV1UCA9_9STRA
MPTSHINYCERLVCGQRYLKVRYEQVGARGNSLLLGKSIKQCIARWYEWLHPTINLAEWSREEEEKLLHHAKLHALAVASDCGYCGAGTAAQCLYHYERLLDAAQKKNSVSGKTSVVGPRDVDEDKKEVLSDAAGGRLASTKWQKDKMKNHETRTRKRED